jgi:hypothetical protein
MATFPTPKVHRVSRRKLGRAQYPPVQAAMVTATTATPDVTLTFSSAVIANAVPPFTVAGLTILSWTQPTDLTIALVMSGVTTAQAWQYTANSTAVLTRQGGQVAGNSGTF